MAERPAALPAWLTAPAAGVDVLVPDGGDLAAALARSTVVGVGAHPDDLELLGIGAIGGCRDDPDRWFTGVTVTDGAGAVTAGPFADLAPDELAARRRQEQRNAARVGRYSAQVQLGRPSADLRHPADRGQIMRRLTDLLVVARPELVLTHDPFDRHPTHVAVAAVVLEACRALPAAARPARVLGVEVWGSLDWLPDADRVRLDVSGHADLARRLLAAHASQVEGKAYAEAAEGRRRANATFDDPRSLDGPTEVQLAVELTALVHDDELDVGAHLSGLLRRASDARAATLTQALAVAPPP